MVQSAALGPVASLSLHTMAQLQNSGELGQLLEPRWHRGSVSAGLNNMGNTCYLNSVLQCLAHLPPLGNLCFAKAHRNSCPAGQQGQQQGCICCLVEGQLWRQLYGNSRAPFRPEAIYSRVLSLNRGFIRGRQEDAHELLRCLTDAMEGCLLRQAMGFNPQRRPRCPKTWVNSLFQGILQSQVRCLRCGHVSNSYDPFMDLSLELSQGCSSVKHCLDDYTAAERLDGKNKYRCDGCKQLVDADKQITIWDDPNVLVVHLKRFHDFHGHKLSQPIQYPHLLCLEPYMCSTRRLQQQQPRPAQQEQQPWQQLLQPQQHQQQQQPLRGVPVFNGSGYTRAGGRGQTPHWGFGNQQQQNQQQQRQLQQRQQQHQMFLKQQQLHQQQHKPPDQQQQEHGQPQHAGGAAAAAGAAAPNRSTPGEYLLHGVLVHSGNSANSGHYYAYVRSGEQHQKWFCANDCSVYNVVGNEAMGQVRGAYMLFYVRRSMKEQADLPAQPEAAPSAAPAAAAAVAQPRPVKRVLDDGGGGAAAAARVIGPQLPPHLLLNKRQRVLSEEEQQQAGEQSDMDLDSREEQQQHHQPAAAAAAIGPQLPPGWRPTDTAAEDGTPNGAIAAAPGVASPAANGHSSAAAAAAAAEATAVGGMALSPAAAAARAAEARMAAAATRGQPSMARSSSSSGPWQPFDKPRNIKEGSKEGSSMDANNNTNTIKGSSSSIAARPASPVIGNALAGLLPDYEDEEDDIQPAPQQQQQQTQTLAQAQEQPDHHQQAADPAAGQQQEQQAPLEPPSSNGEGGGGGGCAPDFGRLESELTEQLKRRPEIKQQLVQGLKEARDKGMGVQQCKAALLSSIRNSSPVMEAFEEVWERVVGLVRLPQSAISAISACL